MINVVRVNQLLQEVIAEQYKNAPGNYVVDFVINELDNPEHSSDLEVLKDAVFKSLKGEYDGNGEFSFADNNQGLEYLTEELHSWIVDGQMAGNGEFLASYEVLYNLFQEIIRELKLNSENHKHNPVLYRFVRVIPYSNTVFVGTYGSHTLIFDDEARKTYLLSLMWDD